MRARSRARSPPHTRVADGKLPIARRRGVKIAVAVRVSRCDEARARVFYSSLPPSTRAKSEKKCASGCFRLRDEKQKRSGDEGLPLAPPLPPPSPPPTANNRRRRCRRHSLHSLSDDACATGAAQHDARRAMRWPQSTSAFSVGERGVAIAAACRRRAACSNFFAPPPRSFHMLMIVLLLIGKLAAFKQSDNATGERRLSTLKIRAIFSLCRARGAYKSRSAHNSISGAV